MERESPWRILTAEPGEPLERLDLWLVFKLPGLSRRSAKRLIAEGAVRVAGRIPQKAAPLSPGDEVALWAEPELADWEPLPDPTRLLKIIFADDYLMAVDKPAGIPSVPLRPGEGGTLAGMVVAAFPECARIGRRPGDGGLIQRLDRETSGVALAARRQDIHSDLVLRQSRGEIEKVYLALVPHHDKPLPERIDLPLSPAGRDSRRVAPREGGDPATTWTRRRGVYGPWQLVEATIRKGFRHQIRAHLAAVGFPIAGDLLYGGEPVIAGLDRLFLHAESVRLVHPVTGEERRFSAALPEALSAILGGRGSD